MLEHLLTDRLSVAQTIVHFITYFLCFLRTLLKHQQCQVSRKPIFTQPGPQARPSHGIDLCVCLFVCLFVCLSVPPSHIIQKSPIIQKSTIIQESTTIQKSTIIQNSTINQMSTIIQKSLYSCYLYFCISENCIILMVQKLKHGFDKDSWYRHGLMVQNQASGTDMGSLYRHGLMVQTKTHGMDIDSWY